MKTGLLLSRDDGAISETVDVDALGRDFGHLPVLKVYESFFTAPNQRDVVQTILDHQLEAVVLAGNSPRYFHRIPSGSSILDAIVATGINPNRIAFANLKEQVAFAHFGRREDATRKARALIEAALAKVEVTHPIESVSVAPRRVVLVLGMTEGGLLATQGLLGKGYRVHLVDARAEISTSDELREALRPTVAAVEANPLAAIHAHTEVIDVSGWSGEYTVRLNNSKGAETHAVGGIILAVGADTELIRRLRPLFQLDTDETGQIRGDGASGVMGRTKDPGVWFIPPLGAGGDLSHATAYASAVVLHLTTQLDQNELRHPVYVSEVDESVCGGCGTCVKTCAFAASAVDIQRKLSTIDVRRCKGCGNCVVACPTGARDLMAFPEDHVVRSIGILARAATTSSEPKVLALLCNGCGYPAADQAGELATQARAMCYSPNVMPVQVECGGNVDTQYVLEAFREGFDGVAVTVCRDGHCHHVVGNTDMDRRLGLFREVLRSRNIDPERLRVIHVAPHEGRLFTEEIQAFCQDLKGQSVQAVS